MCILILVLQIPFRYAERIDSASDFNRARFGVGVCVAFHIVNIMPADSISKHFLFTSDKV